MASPWPHFPRNLEFGSHFVYPSPATTAAEQNARTFLLRMKQDFISPVAPHERLIDRAVARIHTVWLRGTHRPFFGPNVTLIPAPGSGRQKPNTISSPRTICEALVARGLAARTFPCIERLTAVPKSAYAAARDRPTAQLHFDSMRVRRGIEDFEEIVVVDDIVTRGATLIAAAARLAEVYPGATVRAFAVARTKKMSGGIEEPCVGTISVNHEQCRRQP